jgi:hypothetical protein
LGDDREDEGDFSEEEREAVWDYLRIEDCGSNRYNGEDEGETENRIFEGCIAEEQTAESASKI